MRAWSVGKGKVGVGECRRCHVMAGEAAIVAMPRVRQTHIITAKSVAHMSSGDHAIVMTACRRIRCRAGVAWAVTASEPVRALGHAM